MRHVDFDLRPERCWDAINLEDVFQKLFSVLQCCPRHVTLGEVSPCLIFL